MADYQMNRQISKDWKFANDIPLSQESKVLFEKGAVMHYMCGNLRESQFGLVAVSKADVMTNLLDTIDKQDSKINKLFESLNKMNPTPQVHANGVTNGVTNTETSV